MRRGIAGLCGVMLLLSVSLARADEEKVELKDVPKAVMAAFKARFKTAKPTGATKEKEGDMVVYEVTFKDKGKNVNVTITPKGEIIMIEKEISIKALPKAVTKGVEKKYPKSKITLAEEVFKVAKKKETLSYYEVQVTTAAKKKVELQLSPEGKILKEEKKDKKDE